MKPLLPGDLVRVAVKYYDGLATPVAQACKQHLLNGDWDALASMRASPKDYTSADSYRLDACAVSFLRKMEELPTSFDRAGKALENFWKAERECWRTNERLEPYLRDPREWAGDAAVRELTARARKIIESVIGERPPSSVTGRFGPGATFGDRGVYTTIPDKMSSDPTLTLRAKWSLWDFSGTLWAKACSRDGRSPTFVRGNRFTTVPKDCEKDRGIAVEPSINLFYQLGWGRVIRARLGRARLDLVNGQTIHRQVARVASIQGTSATIDLSNASDTICKTLVRLLLPWRWFEVLDALRSPCTLVNNRWVVLEKFSSMGNGFTFELETLLFAAISKAALAMQGQPCTFGRDVYVYGDDIIVPTLGAKGVISALQFLGFTVNKEKSFVDGPFRESCGGDYFKGVDVRPFFLKELPNEPQDWIAAANGIRRAGMAQSDQMDPRFLRAWLSSLDCIPSNIRRCRGPADLGDIVLHDDPQRWRIRSRFGIRYVGAYRPHRYQKVSWAHFRPNVVLASAVYGLSDGITRRDAGGDREVITADGIVPRKPKMSYKVGWVPFS